MDLVVAHPLVPFVSFTGSVANGRRVETTAAGISGPGFKSVGLELGGKDAAYIRAGTSFSPGLSSPGGSSKVH